MTPIDFKLYFEKCIRVQLNWGLLLSSNCSIEFRYLSLPNQGDLIYTPWYIDTNGLVCPFSENNAKPQSVKDAASNNSIRTNYRVLSTFLNPSILLVPAYDLQQKDYILLLDGNHRAVSAQISASKVGILAVVIVKGPIDSNVLPDLMHW